MELLKILKVPVETTRNQQYLDNEQIVSKPPFLHYAKTNPVPIFNYLFKFNAIFQNEILLFLVSQSWFDKNRNIRSYRKLVFYLVGYVPHKYTIFTPTIWLVDIYLCGYDFFIEKYKFIVFISKKL